MFRQITVPTLDIVLANIAMSMGTNAYRLVTIIIPSPPNLSSFPQSQTAGYMSLILLPGQDGVTHTNIPIINRVWFLELPIINWVQYS